MYNLQVCLSATTVDSDTNCTAEAVIEKIAYWMTQSDVHEIIIRKIED